MKKKIISLLVIIVILLAIVPQMALASASVSADKASAYPGETVSISGTVGADESVVIKITDEAGNIVFFDAAKADASGKYSAAFIVPSDMAEGKLTVTAGSGSDVATTTIIVKAAAQPTAKPTTTASPTSTAKPTAKPSSTTSPTGTATPTAGASSTATPTGTATPTSGASSTATPTGTATPTESADDTPSPSASGNEPSPSASGEEDGSSLIPKEISQDEETGIITIVIDVDDLPEGTVAIQTPDGKILYVSDATDGVLMIEVMEDDVDMDGDIEIVALDDEMTPLAALRIEVLDENEEIIKTGEDGGGVWIIIVCVAGGLLVLGAVLWILLRRRNKHGDTVKE